MPVLSSGQPPPASVDLRRLDSTYVRNASSLLINHHLPLLMRMRTGLNICEECQFSPHQPPPASVDLRMALDSTYVRNASSLLINHQVPASVDLRMGGLNICEECQFSPHQPPPASVDLRMGGLNICEECQFSPHQPPPASVDLRMALDSTYVRNASSLLINHHLPLLT